MNISHRHYDYTGFDYFKSGWRRIWPDLGTQIQPEPGLGELVFRSQNNMPDETNGEQQRCQLL